MRYRKRNAHSREPLVPRQVCILHNDGNRLYAIPHTWQAMHDFLQTPEPFALGGLERELGAMPGGEKLKERVWAKVGQFNNTISVGNALWGINDMPIEPASTVRVVVTEHGPRAFRY